MSRGSVLEVNGEARTYDNAALPGTLADLLKEMDLDPQLVVAEVNGDIVSRKDFGSKTLAGGDKIELVRFVGGG